MVESLGLVDRHCRFVAERGALLSAPRGRTFVLVHFLRQCGSSRSLDHFVVGVRLLENHRDETDQKRIERTNWSTDLIFYERPTMKCYGIFR